MTYTPPKFINPANGLEAELTHDAIKLARDDSDLFILCMDVIRTISAQEVYRINIGTALEKAGVFTFTEGRVLDAATIELIKANLVPIHKLELVTYIQKLAKQIAVNDAIVSQYAQIVRKGLIYNGLLHLVAVQETVDNVTVTSLKVPNTYDTNGITPLTYRDINYNDVMSVVEIMLKNESFIDQLTKQMPL